MSSILKLEDFLPGYPSYEDEDDENFNIYSQKNMESANYLKQEFLETKLELSEDKPKTPGSLLKHQKFISRFLSPKTLNDEILLFHSVGSGKCMAENTPVIMYSGEIKMIQDIKEGELVMGDDSTPRKVLKTITGEDEMYDIIPVKGEKYTVNGAHVLCLKYSGSGGITFSKTQKKKPYKVTYFDQENMKRTYHSFATEKEAQEYLDSLTEEDHIVEIEVDDYLELPNYVKLDLKGYRKGIEFPKKKVLFDPYIIGFWIGDGSKRSSVITSQDSTVLKYIRYSIIKDNLILNYQSGYSYRISADSKGSDNLMLQALKRYKLINNKHIPPLYLINSREVRLKLLAGLIDSDGDYSEKCFSITQKIERLADDIVYLCRSLGYAAYKSKRKGTWTYKGVKKTGDYFRVSISGNNMSEIPTKIPRKRAEDRTQIKDPLITGIKVVPIGKGKYYGFTLDGNHRYLLGDCTVTHNSCSSVAIAELSKKMDTTLNRTLVLVKGSTVEKNFKNQLVYQCTNGKYIPEDVDHITEGQKSIRTSKKISANYEFRTFQTFASKLSKMSDYYITKEYSNRIIIIDEAHNIRLNPNQSVTIQVYYQIHRFLHLIQNRKIILMTATPMRDLPEEFAAIMNLILPLDRQLPTTNKFKEKYFDGNKLINTLELQSYIRGRVSYLRSAHSNLRKIFEGEVLKDYNMERIKVVPSIMSKFQTKYYDEAFSIDTNTELNDDVIAEEVEEAEDLEGETSSGIYNKSRQASLFVFPDGSYGGKSTADIKKGISKYTVRKGNNLEFTTEMKNLLTKDGNRTLNRDEKIERIRKYSSKYAEAIDKITSPGSEKENTFVFCDLIEGSGAYLFCLLLELFNFEKSKGITQIEKDEDDIDEKEEYKNDEKKGKKKVVKKEISDEDDEDDESENKKKVIKEREIINSKEVLKTREEIISRPKYAIITGDISINNIERLLSVFNNKNNSEGKFLRVIVGSRVIGEGTSLLNVRQIHILTPFWNNSMTEQAIGRGIRAFSHEDLPPEERYVVIYRHASITLSKTRSIDMIQYKRSEDKDFLMKQIERQCKISAVDCFINFSRNYREDDIDNSEECDYMNCKYKCLNIDIKKIQNEYLITDTYNLYYADEEIETVITIIKKLFRTHFRYDLTEISNIVRDISPIVVVRALKKIIDSSVIIINRYGFPCFLREDKNLYFLVDRINLPNSFELSTYVEHPNVRQEITFTDAIKLIQYKTIDTRLDMFDTYNFDNKNDKESFVRQLKNLTTDLQSVFLESALLAKVTKKNNKSYYNTIIDTYSASIIYTKNKDNKDIIVTNLFGNYRCLQNKDDSDNYSWDNCPINYKEEIEENKREIERDIEKNSYYGIQIGDVFKIVAKPYENLTEKKGGDIDKRKIRIGKVATSYHVKDLIRIALDLGIKAPENEDYETVTYKSLEKDKKKSKILEDLRKNYMTGEKYLLDFKNNEILNDILKWQNKDGNKKILIAEIKKYFLENNLIKIKAES